MTREELLASLPSEPEEREAALIARVLELEADKARLNWLEDRGFSTRQGNDRRMEKSMGVHSWWDQESNAWRWTAAWISSDYSSARDAIDDAMNGASK